MAWVCENSFPGSSRKHPHFTETELPFQTVTRKPAPPNLRGPRTKRTKPGEGDPSVSGLGLSLIHRRPEGVVSSDLSTTSQSPIKVMTPWTPKLQKQSVLEDHDLFCFVCSFFALWPQAHRGITRHLCAGTAWSALQFRSWSQVSQIYTSLRQRKGQDRHSYQTGEVRSLCFVIHKDIN